MSVNKSREIILDSAIEIFAASGFEGASMRDIAKHAKFTTPVIYHFFGDKRSLYRAAVLSCFQRVERKAVAPLMTRQPARNRLKKFLHGFMNLYLNNEHFTKLHVHAYLDSEASLKEDLVNQTLQPPYDALRDTLNEIRAGAGEGPMPMILMSSLLGYTLILPYRRRLARYAEPVRAENIERALFIESIMSMIDSPSLPVVIQRKKKQAKRSYSGAPEGDDESRTGPTSRGGPRGYMSA